MHDLAIQFRAMQFIAHRAHNLTSGPTFFEDHEHFAKLYATYEDAYDAVIERIIGIGGVPDINAITVAAGNQMAASPNEMSPDDYFAIIAEMETQLRLLIDTANKGALLGVQNMLQQFADDSQKRSYLIGQRIK